MSRIAMTALAEAMFGCDAEHIPAYVNDDMVAARLLEFLGDASMQVQAREPAPPHAGRGRQLADHKKEIR